MPDTPAQFMDKLRRPKSRWAYGLRIVLTFNSINDSHKTRDWTSVGFWLCRVLAHFFGLVWFTTTLSSLREFGCNLWWITVFTLPWFGVIWIFWWNPGRLGIAALALWFVSQSLLILKNDRPGPHAREAQGNA